MLRDVCRELLKFQEGAWALQLAGPAPWMLCTRDSSRQLPECHQLCGMCGAGLSHCVQAYPRVSSGALWQAGPLHSYPPSPQTPQIPQQISSFCFPVSATGLFQFQRAPSSEVRGAQLLWAVALPRERVWWARSSGTVRTTLRWHRRHQGSPCVF